MVREKGQGDLAWCLRLTSLRSDPKGGRGGEGRGGEGRGKGSGLGRTVPYPSLPLPLPLPPSPWAATQATFNGDAILNLFHIVIKQARQTRKLL